MSVVNTVRVLPRIVIGGYVQAARLPLTAVQRIARQQDNETWAPVVAFDSFEAKLDTVLGLALRDDTLLEKGAVQTARVEQLRKAATLDTVAEIKAAEAEEKKQARQAEIAEQRDEAARRAEQRKNDIERQAALHEQKVEQKAAKKTAAARKVKAAQDKSIDRQERAKKAEALKAESRAMTVVKESLDTREAAAETDAEIEQSKNARSAG
jgi:membrane-bound lytic murein transglycosylase